MAYLLGFIGVFIFGASLPATAFALQDFSPWFATFARAAIAMVCAWTWLLIRRHSLSHPSNIQLFTAGLLLIFGFPGFMALGLQTVPASHGGVVLGLLPISTAAVSAMIAQERPSIRFWLLSALGAVTVVAYAYFHQSDPGNFGVQPGDVWLFLAVICAATGYVISGKLSRNLSGQEVISRALILNTPIIIAGTYWFWDINPMDASTSSIVGLFYIGLFSMFLGFFAWNTALAMGGIARVGQIQLLQIFITVCLSALLLGERIDIETVLAATIITVIIALTRKT